MNAFKSKQEKTTYISVYKTAYGLAHNELP
jgi:hypothetical protein